MCTPHTPVQETQITVNIERRSKPELQVEKMPFWFHREKWGSFRRQRVGRFFKSFLSRVFSRFFKKSESKFEADISTQLATHWHPRWNSSIFTVILNSCFKNIEVTLDNTLSWSEILGHYNLEQNYSHYSNFSHERWGWVCWRLS